MTARTAGAETLQTWRRQAVELRTTAPSYLTLPWDIRGSDVSGMLASTSEAMVTAAETSDCGDLRRAIDVADAWMKPIERKGRQCGFLEG